MEVQAPSPQTTLVILLGASAWPFMPDFERSEAFANAARSLKDYFLNPRLFGLPVENLLNLFDADLSADKLDVAIGQFLQQRLAIMKARGNAGRDLLFYFIGHGGFAGDNHEYYLAIRRTRIGNPLASGLQVASLAYTLKELARHLRRIIILDCCFAAAAFSAFQAGPDQVALEKTIDAFRGGHKTEGVPTKGTTLFCSSGQMSPSLLLPDYSSTMFTKAFLDALIQGTPSQRDHLTLRDVKEATWDFLSEIGNASRPVVNSPDQSEGDVADIPFFPNPYVERERTRLAEEEKRRQAKEAERTRRMEEERQRRVEEERARLAEEERVRRAQQLLQINVPFARQPGLQTSSDNLSAGPDQARLKKPQQTGSFQQGESENDTSSIAGFMLTFFFNSICISIILGNLLHSELVLGGVLLGGMILTVISMRFLKKNVKLANQQLRNFFVPLILFSLMWGYVGWLCNSFLPLLPLLLAVMGFIIGFFVICALALICEKIVISVRKT